MLIDWCCTGDVLAEYLGPLPSQQQQGEHRFIFLAYRQPDEPIDVERVGLPHAEPCDWAVRARFSSSRFAQLYDLGRPVAVNYFVTQYDASVPQTIERCLIQRQSLGRLLSQHISSSSTWHPLTFHKSIHTQATFERLLPFFKNNKSLIFCRHSTLVLAMGNGWQWIFGGLRDVYITAEDVGQVAQQQRNPTWSPSLSFSHRYTNTISLSPSRSAVVASIPLPHPSSSSSAAAAASSHTDLGAQ